MCIKWDVKKMPFWKMTIMILFEHLIVTPMLSFILWYNKCPRIEESDFRGLLQQNWLPKARNVVEKTKVVDRNLIATAFFWDDYRGNELLGMMSFLAQHGQIQFMVIAEDELRKELKADS